MQYSKNEHYYLDLYDLFTIKDCLEIVDYWRKAYRKYLKDGESKGLSKDKIEKAFNYSLNLQLYSEKTSRYQKKKETVEKWIEKDRIEQDKYDKAKEPQDILFSSCNVSMNCTFKTLENYTDRPLRVLFFFECLSCKKRKGIYDNGEEYLSKPDLCPECKKN
jgi:hypothetical protein